MPLPETTSYTNPDPDGGSVTFGDITFTKPGTYTYTITETGKVPGITNDANASQTVKIVVEDNGDGTLTATVDPEADITFTNKMDLISIPVTKVWEGEVDAAKTRPESITVKLLADGTDSGLTLELSEKNKWSDTFKDLPSHKDGVEIKYTIEEVEVKYYTTTIEGDMTKGFTITNTCTYIKTGDDSNILLWSATMMASMVGIGFTLFKKKREEEDR